MTPGMEHDLMRLLHGELPAADARALRARIFREPELTESFRRLEQTWQGLALPPASPVPPGFAGRVMAHVRSQSSRLSWSAAPGWVRATAAAALVTGAALGIGVGRSWPAPATTSEAGAEASQTFLSATTETNLADSYWSLVEEETSTDANAEAQP